MRGQTAASPADTGVVNLVSVAAGGDASSALAVARATKDTLLKRFPGSAGGGCSADEWNAWAQSVIELKPLLTEADWTELAAVRIDKRRTAFCNASGFAFPGTAQFIGVAFAHGADFSRCHFLGPAEFQASAADAAEDGEVAKTVFSKRVTFEAARFDARADFTDAVFSPSVTFNGTAFMGKTAFVGAEFRRAARFAGVSFHSDIVFEGAGFALDGHGDPTDFARAQFGIVGTADVSFANARFHGAKSTVAPVSFEGAIFHAPTAFDHAIVGTRADGTVRIVDFNLLRAEFRQTATFTGIEVAGDWSLPAELAFDRGADFSRAVVHGNLDFSNAGLSIPAIHTLSFHAANIHGDVMFGRSTITCRLAFDDARLAGRVSGTQATFGEDGRRGKEPHSFKRTDFLSDVILSGCAFVGGLDCDRARFHGQLELIGGTIDGPTRFEAATFSSSAALPQVHFTHPLQARGASFARRVSFEGATFGDASKTRTDRAAETPGADFEGAVFEDFVRFDGATFHGALFLHRIAKSIAITLGGTHFVSGIPKFSQVEFRFAPELDQVKWGTADGSLQSVVAEAKGTVPPRELASRLRALRRIAENERDLALAQQLALLALHADPDRRWGARLFNWGRRCLIGDGDKVMRPVTLLLLATLLIFPTIYAWNRLPSVDLTTVAGAEKAWIGFRDLRCDNQVGHPFVSAIHASARSALFAIPDLEERAKQVAICLHGKDDMDTLPTRWPSLIPILQSLISAILLFAIGSAVRNRMRVR